MTEFYRFPQWSLTMLVMITAVCIVLQTLTVSYSVRRLPAGWSRTLPSLDRCSMGCTAVF